jgi:hypothetical protein
VDFNGGDLFDKLAKRGHRTNAVVGGMIPVAKIITDETLIA